MAHLSREATVEGLESRLHFAVNVSLANPFGAGNTTIFVAGTNSAWPPTR